MKIFDLKKKILFEIPDQKTVLKATLKSEFSKNFFCTLISIPNTSKKSSLTKSIDKSGHSLGDSFILEQNKRVYKQLRPKNAGIYRSIYLRFQ